MVLYGLSIIPLSKAMRNEEPGLLQTWYAINVAMQGLARLNTNILRDLMVKVPHRGFFMDPEKSLHICVKGREE